MNRTHENKYALKILLYSCGCKNEYVFIPKVTLNDAK